MSVPADLQGRIDMMLGSLVKKYEALDVIEGAPFTAQHEETLAPLMPGLLVGMWKHFGFAGFDNGRFWLCDPLAWKDASDAWTESLDLVMGEDDWWPVVRTAFGQMDLWGPALGPSLSVVPLTSVVEPFDNSDRMAQAQTRETAAFGMLSATDSGLDLYDDNEKGLFEQCLAKLGPVLHDTMYTFVPVPQLGGRLDIASATTEKAVPHIILLAQMQHGNVSGDIVATRKARETGVDDWLSDDQ